MKRRQKGFEFGYKFLPPIKENVPPYLPPADQEGRKTAHSTNQVVEKIQRGLPIRIMMKAFRIWIL